MSLELDIECIVCNKKLRTINHNFQDPYDMRKIGRRSRTPNWSTDEKQCLLDLIKERKEIVVNKPNAPNNYEEKDGAWNEILRELTARFGTKFSTFSIKKLKTQWQNMKRIAREEINTNGVAVQNYTRQSFEVCNILDMIKDGQIKKEEKLMEPILKTDVEVKSECIDDEMNEASCSMEKNAPAGINSIVMESSSSQDQDLLEINERDVENQRTAETMTEPTLHFNPLSQMHNILKLPSTEKEIKMETLKEERQIIKAMRETAELNKVIAEQKLKHFLWVKKQEMA